MLTTLLLLLWELRQLWLRFLVLIGRRGPAVRGVQNMPADITASCLDTLAFTDKDGRATAAPPGTVWVATPPAPVTLTPTSDGSACQITANVAAITTFPVTVTVTTTTPNPVSGGPDILTTDTVTVHQAPPGPATAATQNFSNIV